MFTWMPTAATLTAPAATPPHCTTLPAGSTPNRRLHGAQEPDRGRPDHQDHLRILPQQHAAQSRVQGQRPHGQGGLPELPHPEFARVNPTKMSWDWSQSGKLKDGKPYKTRKKFGKDIDYLTIKGQMKWAKNVKPEYFWYNGSISSTTAKDPSIHPRSSGSSIRWAVRMTRIPGFPRLRSTAAAALRQVHKTLLAPMLSGPDGYWTNPGLEGCPVQGQCHTGHPLLR
jgi:hypothetical protein